MPRSIAELLNDYGITHNLPSDSPILNLPLSQFKENEYPDLITMVLFYDSKWFDPLKMPSTDKKIGEVSLQQSTMFYGAVRDKVVSIMSSANTDSTMSITITLPSSYGWVTPTQITFILSKMTLFTKMMKLTQCDTEHQIMLNWILNGTLSTEDKEYLDHLLLFHTLNHTQKTAETVVAKELFKGEKFGQTSESYSLTKTLQKKLQTDSSDLPESISGFFMSVVNILIGKYVTPISSVLSGINATIPENLPKDLNMLLKENIEQVPDLRDEEWTTFIYFILLFLHQYAVADPILLYYAYVGSDDQLAFKRCTEEHKQKFLQKLDGQQVVYQADLAATLGVELEKFNVTAHPGLLALFCFERCEPLKQLFIKIWKSQGIQTENLPTYALLPGHNRFTFGETFYDLSQRALIPATCSEAGVVMKLKQLDLDLKSRESGASGKFFALDSKKEQKVPQTRYEFIQEFNTLSSQVNNPKLKPFLCIESLGNLSTTPAINFQAVIDFVSKYQFRCEWKEVKYPPTDELREFHQLAGNEPVYDTINRMLVNYHARVNLQDSVHLAEQLVELDKRIDKLTLLTEVPYDETEESKLRSWWLQAQLKTFRQFKTKVEEKLEELATMPQQGIKFS